MAFYARCEKCGKHEQTSRYGAEHSLPDGWAYIVLDHRHLNQPPTAYCMVCGPCAADVWGQIEQQLKFSEKRPA